MPTMPPHRCARCGQLVTGSCPCRAAWTPARPTPRVRGRALQRLREQLFQRQPLCVLCLQKTPPVISVSVVRDHIQNLASGGGDDDANVQGICEACHAEKTQQEATRGRQAIR